ncbi:uncharacterized protein LOC124293551 [Neodiprion lecontei]|uniref:Uncharacterized protein LOC124293551 n=2 Tax=Neodiprion TaxID=270857 RepID=A0ABM3FRK2_NEOLC|nr:uncharacterized protein LOC124293551 [Neodiprion lecontei]
MADLETMLVKRKEKLRSYGLTCQPLIITVGDPTSFSAIYVIVNEVKYAASNLIGAVDMCFKVHYALNAKYSPESETVWVFLQKFFYGIKGCKHFVTVEVVWSDILIHQKSNVEDSSADE